MDEGFVAVLDVGKTNTKLTLWDAGCRVVRRGVRANAPAAGPGYRALDVEGIDRFVAATLREFAELGPIRAIVPVAHGAAAGLVHDGALFTPPMDYEDEGAHDAAAYDALRDPFAETGSPRLPVGLNLGFQLHRLEALTGPWPEDLEILPWPQYWAWRLCGVAAAEVTSLGCHSDLWRPAANAPSRLADVRGWARRLPPMRHAGAPLGRLSAEWIQRTELPKDCLVHAGLHDSNATLLAARGHPELAAGDATVLCTGTWFVAMRSPAPDAPPVVLDEARDGLFNVDVDGRPVPSSRFMGGREAELIGGNLETAPVARAAQVVASGLRLRPSLVPGVGPFPTHRATWSHPPADPAERAAAGALYLALMADACLDLISSRERLVVEGRFAGAEPFLRALAALRPGQQVLTASGQDDVAYGALRLVRPDASPPAPLRPVAPLDVPLDAYRDAWRADVAAVTA